MVRLGLYCVSMMTSYKTSTMTSLMSPEARSISPMGRNTRVCVVRANSVCVYGMFMGVWVLLSLVKDSIYPSVVKKVPNDNSCTVLFVSPCIGIASEYKNMMSEIVSNMLLHFLNMSISLKIVCIFKSLCVCFRYLVIDIIHHWDLKIHNEEGANR